MIGGAGDHRGVFAEEEERELHRAVFRVIAADEFRFGLRQIERQAVRFGEHRDREDEERDEHRDRQEPFLRIGPVADERREQPAVLDLVADDLGQAQLADEEEDRDDGAGRATSS